MPSTWYRRSYRVVSIISLNTVQLHTGLAVTFFFNQNNGKDGQCVCYSMFTMPVEVPHILVYVRSKKKYIECALQLVTQTASNVVSFETEAAAHYRTHRKSFAAWHQIETMETLTYL